MSQPITEHSTTEPKPGLVPSPAEAALARVRSLDSRLDGVDDLTLADAARRFDAVHGELQAALTDLDSA